MTHRALNYHQQRHLGTRAPVPSATLDSSFAPLFALHGRYPNNFLGSPVVCAGSVHAFHTSPQYQLNRCFIVPSFRALVSHFMMDLYVKRNCGRVTGMFLSRDFKRTSSLSCPNERISQGTDVSTVQRYGHATTRPSHARCEQPRIGTHSDVVDPHPSLHQANQMIAQQIREEDFQGEENQSKEAFGPARYLLE